MDEAVGDVLNALKRTGNDENTLIIFFSDNGGAKKNFADNGILRDYKQTVYEGGIRVPFIVRWPEKLPKATVCDEPVISLDVLPTILSAVGASLPTDRSYDGRDMLPVLRGRAKKPLHEALFFCDGSDQWAVRAGKWKLLSRKGSLQLYNLDNDISETNNLASKESDLLKRLKELYDNWRAQMGEPISKPKKRAKKPKNNRRKQK
jgi:arylsulfatase A-like enzyme